MSHFERRAVSPFAFLAIALISASAGAQFRGGGAAAPRPTTAAPPPPSPTTPAVKGWPHSILTGNGVNCARDPQPHEVIIFRDATFGGSCAILQAGFYPFAANFLVGNDAASSIKVGKGVRARVFTNPIYGGEWMIYPPLTMSAALGTFENKISSIRVEPASRSQICDDLGDGEIALFEHRSFRGDCVVLPGEGSYASPESMGIANDSISSLANNSGLKLRTFWHPSFEQASVEVPPRSRASGISADGFMTEGINDNISSIQMIR